MTELTRPGICTSLKEGRSQEGSEVPPVQRPGPPHSLLHMDETMGCIPEGLRGSLRPLLASKPFPDR